MAGKKIGEFLVDKGLVSSAALSMSLEAQRRTPNEPLGNLLVRQGVLDESQLTRALGEFFNMEVLKGQEADLTPETLELIPKAVVLKQGIIPVGLRNGSELLVACASPIPTATLENLRRLTGKRIRPMLMGSAEFATLLKEAYPDDAQGVMAATVKVGAETGADNAVAMVNTVILKALSRRASDIHLEPEDEKLRIRYRVDGTLEVAAELPKEMALLVVSRIKVLAGMDIADRRRPQDGAMVFEHESMQTPPISVRVSTLPCTGGEKAVLRLLPPQDTAVGLDRLGMEPTMLKAFQEICSAPHGIVLVTGPTGSGKSTTLYSVLTSLRSDKTNITTIEDPVEQKTSGITQVQVDNANKVSFAAALRSILRQDPDIIMVGEIRDVETARLALRAALTGHLVFSTLHTNDSPSAFARLLDMGCEHFLLGSSIRGVLAQRLVRIVCKDCAQEYELDPIQLEALQLKPGGVKKYRRGSGCHHCHNSGFHGRMGVYELLTVNEEVRALIARGAKLEEMTAYMAKAGIPTLRQSAIAKLRAGITTPEEVLHITMEW